MKTTFETFVNKVCDGLGLQPCWSIDKRCASTMRLANTTMRANFDNLTIGEFGFYLAEVFTIDGDYIGSIGLERDTVEHYELGVSPYNKYDFKGNPLNESGNEIDGILCRYYNGDSIKRACTSLLNGGARQTNGKRKPIKIW